jgi:hypothetical protein
MKPIRIAAASILALVFIGVVGIAHPQPVSASCAFAQPLPQVLATAPTVFVGTVTATRNLSRTAIVRVERVWRGSHIPRTVVVRGSYVTGHAATSVDRVFKTGVKYLFVPEPATQRTPFQDNACTATQLYTPALEQYRPHRVKGAQP